MPAPAPNTEPITVVELDGRHTVYSAEEWHNVCAELRGMLVCMQFSVLGDRLFKREVVEEETMDSQEEI